MGANLDLFRFDDKILSDNVLNTDVLNTDVLNTTVFDRDDEVLGITEDTNNEINNYISSVAWVNDPKEIKPINYFPYKEDNHAYLSIKFKNIAKGSTVVIKLYDLDVLVDDTITSLNYTVNNIDAVISFDLNSKVFYRGTDSHLQLYVQVVINNKIRGTFCKENSTSLRVDVVRYVPSIMMVKKWLVGVNLQKFWFNAPANNDYKKRLNVADIVKYSYFLRFNRFKIFHDKIVSDKLWINNASKELFVERINTLILSNKASLPKKMMEILNFGNSSSRLVFKDGNRVPEFETLYIQSRSFEQSVFDPLDDLYASLGNFNIRILSFGIISLITSSNKYLISIKKVGFYIEDKFDFEDDQFLGFWSPFHNKVNKIDPENNSFYKISNKSYREYQEKSNIGGNFRLFSDIYFIETNDDYQLDYFEDTQSKKRLLKV